MQPRYRLSVVLRERVQTPILDTVTGRATSATVIVDADYGWCHLPQKVEVLNGTAFDIASYDRFSNRFSNVRAARDAEIRDAKGHCRNHTHARCDGVCVARDAPVAVR